MTPKEAAEILKDLQGFHLLVIEQNKALELAIQALEEKQEQINLIEEIAMRFNLSFPQSERQEKMFDEGVSGENGLKVMEKMFFEVDKCAKNEG